MKKIIFVLLSVILITNTVDAQPPKEVEEVIVHAPDKNNPDTYQIFDDKMILEGYAKKYHDLPKAILLEMIKDDTLSSYKMAAAVRVLKEKYSTEIVSREKGLVEKILIRRLNRNDSPFVQVEIMHTLCRIDRYRYFKSMVPILIQKMDHYNTTINEIAFHALEDLISTEDNRSREARIVFGTLRNVLFLSRKRLADVKEPDGKLSQKLKLLRWAIKILGTDVLKALPKEVLNLL